jgi:small subunit ribosomal protein S8
MEKIDVPSSKLKIEIAKLMKDEGYIANYKTIEDHKQGVLRIYLKYTPEGKRVIVGLKRISKPGVRQYSGYESLPKVASGTGTVIVSTPQGLMSDKTARTERLGGEIIGYIW